MTDDDELDAHLHEQQERSKQAYYDEHAADLPELFPGTLPDEPLPVRS